jgi:hypothetical protein
MNGFPIKPAVDDGGKGPNGEQRAAARRCGHSSFQATTRRSPKIPNAVTAASSGMPKGRAVLYPANKPGSKSRRTATQPLVCGSPLIELQCEFNLRGCDGDDFVNRRAKVPHPNTVEVVAAGHLACDVGFKGGHLTFARARTVERYRGRRPGTAVGGFCERPYTSA